MWAEGSRARTVAGLQLCVTVTGETTEALRVARDQAAEADLVELRLDGLRDVDVAGALADRRLPVVVTCRRIEDGGRFSGADEERRRWLREALAGGAEYVDVEWDAPFRHDLVAMDASRVVLSLHDLSGMPSDLGARYRAMRSTGAAVVKIAVRTSRLSDLLPLAQLGQQVRQADERAVLIGMGNAGVASRVLADRFGSCWSYAGRAAPGQIDAERLVAEFGLRRLSTASELYGVVGNPIMHSLSSCMHNAAFQAVNRDAVYLPLEAADADDCFAFADAFGARGLSVTAPFKEALMSRAKERDSVAERVGAVNTLRRCATGWVGMNSDVAGFLDPLWGRLELKGARAAVVGAGGAARAVCEGLSSVGADVTVYARDRDRARDAAAPTASAARSLPPPGGSWDLLVNATPVGTAPAVDETPVPGTILSGGLVYDLVYNPAETRLLREARAAGCETIGGLDMLVAQAVRQFEWWTGQRLDRSIFREAARARLAKVSEEAAA